MATTKIVLVIALLVHCNNGAVFKDRTGDVSLYTKETRDGLNIQLKRGDVVTLSGTIGKGFNFESNVQCKNSKNCSFKEKLSTYDMEPIDHGFRVTFSSTDLSTQFSDCYELRVGEVNWYGGPERYQQNWPIEKMTLDSKDKSYVVHKSDNFAVIQPYWLNSLGSYIYVDRRTPLFIDQNSMYENVVCFIGKIEDPYVNRQRVVLNYTIISLEDAKEAHLYAVNTVLGKPSGPPNEKMVSEPIWTTWAKYKKDISDDVVLSFANDILDHGYKGGQLEIDDDWERCYGAQEFKSDKFANISNTVKYLKEKNFRVTLWVHPFINSDCQSVADDGTAKGYFVNDTNGSNKADWWDGGDARQIDFTNKDAREWYSARLKKLQDDPGIDSFKFDAGETDYIVPGVYSNHDLELWPNILTEEYIRTCAEFGGLIEVRSGSYTQDLPIFVRMLDKTSGWDNNNGLYTLVTTLLQMNMIGHTIVLPDMIGGNGYNGAPSSELLVRWTQANTFMPAMQFSYLPWDISSNDFDAPAIVKTFVELHEKYSNEILKAINASSVNGTPVNAPIWWLDPADKTALKEDTEYLLGENILVAPVLTENTTSRDVYLPKGTWTDGNNGTKYEGPILIKDYPAPIEVLPYFIKQ